MKNMHVRLHARRAGRAVFALMLMLATAWFSCVVPISYTKLFSYKLNTSRAVPLSAVTVYSVLVDFMPSHALLVPLQEVGYVKYSLCICYTKQRATPRCVYENMQFWLPTARILPRAGYSLDFHWISMSQPLQHARISALSSISLNPVARSTTHLIGYMSHFFSFFHFTRKCNMVVVVPQMADTECSQAGWIIHYNASDSSRDMDTDWLGSLLPLDVIWNLALPVMHTICAVLYKILFMNCTLYL